MAIYYVSATTGHDSADGSAPIPDGAGAGPKATIGAAENLATSAGDIVYIAPGTYRETVTHGYSGTAANRIYFIGDPDCEIFGNTVKPGVVRMTLAADTNEFASNANGTTTGVVVKTNGRDYITWKMFMSMVVQEELMRIMTLILHMDFMPIVRVIIWNV